jgi:hypothetical protein
MDTESNVKNIIGNISNIYKYTNYQSQNQGSYIGLFIIIIFILIVIYLLLESIRQTALLDWNNNRCNPRYMFMAGLIQKDKKDGIQYTYDNFLDCTSKSKNIAEGIKMVNNTNNYMIEKVNNIYEDGSLKLDDIKKELDELDKKSIENKDKTTNISNTMDAIYTQHKRIYNIMDMYIKRLTFVINNIYDYVGNILLYKIYGLKTKLNVDEFHTSIKTEYINIMNSDVKKCYEKYKLNNYKDAINFAANANNRLLALKAKIDKYITDNSVTKSNIEKVCNMFDAEIPQFADYSCDKIFTNYN